MSTTPRPTFISSGAFRSSRQQYTAQDPPIFSLWEETAGTGSVAGIVRRGVRALHLALRTARDRAAAGGEGRPARREAGGAPRSRAPWL